jgi:hypothetical protein
VETIVAGEHADTSTSVWQRSLLMTPRTSGTDTGVVTGRRALVEDVGQRRCRKVNQIVGHTPDMLRPVDIILTARTCDMRLQRVREVI